MASTVIVTGACAVRAPALQPPPVRRPHLRLVGGHDDAPFRRRLPALPATRPRPKRVCLLASDEEVAERWDGMA